MNDFSATQNACDDALPCQQANLFYLGRLPEGCSLDLTGCVNGRQTPMLTPGETYQLPNTLPGTVNRLELMVDGKPHVITEDIRQMAHIGRPEDLKVAVGTAPPPPEPPAIISPGFFANSAGELVDPPVQRMVPVGRVSSARMPGQMGSIPAGSERNALDVISDTAYQRSPPPEQSGSTRMMTSIEAHPSLGAPPLMVEKDVVELTPQEEDWLVRAALMVVGPVHWVDQVMGIAALQQATGADMSLTGTNMPGVVIEAVEMLLQGDKRRFLLEMYGQKISKVWVNSRGNVMISFTGNKLLRKFVTSNVYGAANVKVSLVELAARTRVSAASAVKAVGSRAGALSIAFVTFFDVAEWLSTPAGERDVKDLIATLLWDVAAVTVSIIAGALAAGAVLLLAPGIAATAVLVSVGIGAGVVVGLALDWVDSVLGIKARIRAAMDNAAINDLDPAFYDQMMIAP